MATSPPALAYSVDNCTIGRTLEVLGERWSLVVIREVANGVRRFEDMRRHTDIPRQVLTNRIGSLVDAGILRRHPYREPGERERFEYRFTAKGFDLYPVMVALAQWGDRYLADPEGPPVSFTHRDCGQHVAPVLRCWAGHEIADPRDVVAVPGPGVHPR